MGVLFLLEDHVPPSKEVLLPEIDAVKTYIFYELYFLTIELVYYIGTYFGKTFNIYRNIKHNRGFSHYIKYRNIFCDCIGNGIATTYLGKCRMYKKVVYVISIILCIFIPTMSIHATLWRKNVRGHVHTFNLFVLWEL